MAGCGSAAYESRNAKPTIHSFLRRRTPRPPCEVAAEKSLGCLLDPVAVPELRLLRCLQELAEGRRLCLLPGMQGSGDAFSVPGHVAQALEQGHRADSVGDERQL